MTQKQTQAVNIIKWVGAALLTGITAWTTMKMTVAGNTMTISNNVAELRDVKARVRAVEDCVVEQKVQNKWMKETLTRIENKIDK